jgi:hypothetical protein
MIQNREEIIELLKEPLERLHPGVTPMFLDFLEKSQPLGIIARPMDAYIILEASVNGDLWKLFEIYYRGRGRVRYGSGWSSCLATKIREYPQSDFPWLYDAFRELHRRQGELIGRRNFHLGLTPDLHKVESLPLWGLLQNSEGWIATYEEFLNTVRARLAKRSVTTANVQDRPRVSPPSSSVR